jgi:hypothetical protein
MFILHFDFKNSQYTLSVAANLYKLLQLVLEANFHIHTETDKITVLYIFESLIVYVENGNRKDSGLNGQIISGCDV